MKYHLYVEENCRRVKRIFAQGIYKDKTTKFGNSILQCRIVEYVWEIIGDGKDNVKIGECASLLKGGSWTSLVDSLPRSRGVHGKNNQNLKWGIDDSN